MGKPKFKNIPWMNYTPPYILCLLITFLLISCVTKKKYGAHFVSPNKIKASEYHQLKPEQKVIIKSFQDLEINKEENLINGEVDSSNVSNYKVSVEPVDSLKNDVESPGRFFLSRAHPIISEDDPNLQVPKKNTVRLYRKPTKLDRKSITKSQSVTSLLFLPFIALFVSFSWVLAGIFFVIGGILSISEYLKVRRFVRKVKGGVWADISVSIYGLLAGLLLIYGFLYLMNLWLGRVLLVF